MALIIISNMQNREVLGGDETGAILFQLQQNNIDWMHACGGKGRCTTCKFVIVDGCENLTDLTEAESSYRSNGGLGKRERLACQAKAAGTVVIAVPPSSKLPHINYSDD